MFEIGAYIIYGTKGVCRLEDITKLHMKGADWNRLYYVLTPLGDRKGKIYVPTDNSKVLMRSIMTKKEAECLLEEMPQIEALGIPSEKEREAKYKEALHTCDSRAWVSIIKTLYLRGQERAAQGKKITALDERYMRTAEHELYSELALTLGVSEEQLARELRARLVQK